MWVKRTRRIDMIFGVVATVRCYEWGMYILAAREAQFVRNSKMDSSIHVEAQHRNSNYSNKFYCHKLHLVYKGNI